MTYSSVLSSADPVAPEVTVLSEGPENVLLGSWPNRRFEGVNRAELHSFRHENPWARALVFAGGGYTQLVYDKEGAEAAIWLNGLGLDAHVVVHRLPGQNAVDGGVHPKDIALKDGLRALDVLADENEDLPLFVLGLSSGGHMAGVMACQDAANHARGVLIAYAPLNANHCDHKFPPDKPDYPPVEKQAFYNDWPIGLADHAHGIPKIPAFLAYALYDKSVPIQHALRSIETAAQTGWDLDAHIFADAPHGFALRELDGTQAAWPDLAAQWMRHRAKV